MPEPRRLPLGLTRIGAKALAIPSVTAHFGFGLVHGLLPCGLVYSALAMASAAGDAWRAGPWMFAFGLGTVPLLTAGAWTLQRMVQPRRRMRRALALAVLTVGCRTVGARAALGDTTAAGAFLRHCQSLLRGTGP